ncbi:MAG: flagellar assembly protein FliW [Nitrospirae bacterium]|nr:flagellar assembly protein FliW [Nitrospirota bacterium]
MKFSTTRFDVVEVGDDKIIDFPRGVIGFKELKRFVILPHSEPIQWMQAVDDSDVAFIVTDPFPIFPEYSFKVDDFVEEYLECKDVKDVMCLVILTVEDHKLMAHLKTPIIINTSSMRAAHLVLDADSIPVKIPVPCSQGESLSDAKLK